MRQNNKDIRSSISLRIGNKDSSVNELMPGMVNHLLLAFLLVTTSAIGAAGGEAPYCPMRPAHLEFHLPKQGLTHFTREGPSGACEDIPASAWTKVPSKPWDVWVHADGPHGSGRFWTLTLGVGTGQGTKPARGFCLTTSTVGWRTLQRFGRALMWVDDLDKDGKAELVIWDSFPLSDDPSMAEYGLVAWVYQLAESAFTVDWRLSRKMAEEIAAAYREPLERNRPLQPLRDAAAHELEMFAREGCRMPSSSAR